jgi:hypothetical protein
MAVVAFDTLKLADRLEAGGFTAIQARTAAGAFADAMSESDLATKADLGEAKTDLKTDIAAVKAELKGDIAAVKAELKSDIAAVKAELKGDIAGLKVELKGDLAGLKVELKGDLAGLKVELGRLEERIERRAAETESRLTKWLVCTAAAAILTIVGAAWTIIRYLPPHP